MTFISLDNVNKIINSVFDKYNHKKYIHPDPIEFLYHYDNVKDREIVALIASSLAYGRVNQILKSVSYILKKISPSPYSFIMNNSFDKMSRTFSGFKHRFSDGHHIAALLFGIKKVLIEFGSLNECFTFGFVKNGMTLLDGLIYFVGKIRQQQFNVGHLLADPRKKSACKRLNLFLRWMLRNDNIDPGGWTGVPISKLIIPLDTHMHHIGISFSFTKRRYASLKTAIEVTDGFRIFAPKDPLKYDFSLTRIGILNGPKLLDFLN